MLRQGWNAHVIFSLGRNTRVSAINAVKCRRALRDALWLHVHSWNGIKFSLWIFKRIPKRYKCKVWKKWLPKFSFDVYVLFHPFTKSAMEFKVHQTLLHGALYFIVYFMYAWDFSCGSHFSTLVWMLNPNHTTTCSNLSIIYVGSQVVHRSWIMLICQDVGYDPKVAY